MKRISVVLAGLVLVGSVAVAETDYQATKRLNDIVSGKDNANQIRVLRVLGAGTVGGALTVTGGVVGDTTGDVTGNVTGDLTGNVTGDVTGDLTGNVTGNVTGDVTGDLTGDVTGNTTGSHTGSVNSSSLQESAINGPLEIGNYLQFTPLSLNVTNTEALTLDARAQYNMTGTLTTNVDVTIANPDAGGASVVIVNAGTNTITFTKAANLALGGATRELGQYDLLELRALSAAVWVEKAFIDNTLGP